MKMRNPVVPDGCKSHDPNSVRSGGSKYVAAGN
jgi:hypothetical protein